MKWKWKKRKPESICLGERKRTLKFAFCSGTAALVKNIFIRKIKYKRKKAKAVVH